MKALAILTTLIISFSPYQTRADAYTEFFVGMLDLKKEYRKNIAPELKKADKAVIYLVDFDSYIDENGFISEPEKFISVFQFNRSAKILDSKELTKDERELLISALADQIAIPKQSEGAACHMPIHGIRIYKGERIIHEGTFCWACQNFSFSYPTGRDWLHATPALKKKFNELMPIPQKELDRFEAKYPSKK